MGKKQRKTKEALTNLWEHTTCWVFKLSHTGRQFTGKLQSSITCRPRKMQGSVCLDGWYKSHRNRGHGATGTIFFNFLMLSGRWMPFWPSIPITWNEFETCALTIVSQPESQELNARGYPSSVRPQTSPFLPVSFIPTSTPHTPAPSTVFRSPCWVRMISGPILRKVRSD